MERNQFRVFAHTNMAVDAMIRRAGLERFFSYKSLLWNIEVYRRSAS
jgi:hypothetical protein